MKPEIKELWINTLRSGEYIQNQGQLKDDRGYCCLGVLTDLYIREHNEEWTYGENNGYEYDFRSGSLPYSVVEWAQLMSDNPSIEHYTLAHYNDSLDYNFNQIADLIEGNL